MNIIEETYHKCPACNAEARGIVELNRVFGYYFQGEEIELYEQCKACRGVNEFGESPAQERTYKRGQEEWNTVTCWARKIHISGARFTEYLTELGYLEAEDGAKEVFQITPKGYGHCRIARGPLRDVVQWDFEAYVDVARRRAQLAEVHDICPKCKANLDETPEYNHLEPVHICGRCGHVCREWGVRVIYDR